MFCKNCGAEIKEGLRFCPTCGASQQSGPEPVHDTRNVKQTSGSGSGTNTLAVVSLILGLLSIILAIPGSATWSMGLVIAAVICGVLAIVFSSMSKKNHGSSGFATAGLVLGIIGLIWAAIMLISIIACYARINSISNSIYDLF